MTNHEILMDDAQRVCTQVDLSGLRAARILITGASGLIGTAMLATVANLRASGMELEVVAQVFSPATPELSALVALAEGQIVRKNLARLEDCAELPKSDIIIHAAGYGQPGLFMADPLTALRLNTVATSALLDCLAPGGRLLFTSSSEVYQGLDKSEVSETDIGSTTPEHPRACYIEGKRGGEALCHAFRAHGGQAVAARISHTYGPGTRPGDKRALNAFIQKALTHGEIELLDAGEATRTYGYIGDLATDLWNILLHGKQAVYNVGGRSTVTIAELAALIGNLTGATVKLPAESRAVAGAPREVKLNLQRIETEFGPQARVGLEEGLNRTIAWQRNLYPN